VLDQKKYGAILRILFVSHYFAPSSGAAAIRLSALARRLAKCKHEITVLTPMPHYPTGTIEKGFRGHIFKTVKYEGVRVIYVGLWATADRRISRRFLSQASAMVMLICRGIVLPRPDVVFVEAQPMLIGLAGCLIALIKRASYVLNVSDLWPEVMLYVGNLSENNLIYRLAKFIARAEYKMARHIVTLSPHWTRAIQQELDTKEDKVSTILRGVEIDYLRAPSKNAIEKFRKENGLDLNKISVCFFGTFATQYDFDTILKVVAHFSSRPGVVFVFIGVGSQEALLEDTLAEKNLSNVLVFGWMDYKSMPMAWSVADLTYWAMRPDQIYFGTVPAKLFEAFATGTPIVAAQGGVASDIICAADAGITVEPGDCLGLIAEIERLLDDSALRQRLGENGRAFALRNFDFERVARRYEEIMAGT